jgi:dTDP-4-dehydrorhamnose 3,5-epimerase
VKFNKTAIEGALIIEHDVHEDSRGVFVKTFHQGEFSKAGLEVEFRESYYTHSRENVIRGMHFQVSPHDHAKVVTVIDGAVADVILDLRQSSPTLGQHIVVELSRENRKSIYIPRGCAHGFRVVGNSATVYYLLTSVHAPSHDKGIRFDSFGYNWKVDNPVVSERDLKFPTLTNFIDLLT